MSEGNSYRQILRSSSIIGGASVINIVVGLMKMKVAAVWLGPAGVGLIGMFTNLVSTASGVAAFGVGTVGTRQIAEAVGQDDPHRIWMVRRALFWLTLTLAVFGALLFWLMRGVLADRFLEDSSLSYELGWLSIAVALSVAAASQNALLNGMRRIGDIARLSVGSAVLSTLVAVVALWWGKRAGIVWFVLAAPVASFLLGHWYVSRLPRTPSTQAKFAHMKDQWRSMLRLGFAFMLAGLAGTAGQLAVRALVQRQLGENALGHFQAAWSISMTYIAFVLGAMGTDYYPRLTAVIRDPRAVNRLVNEQTEVALLLSAPVLLGMMALAPLVIRLLYSVEFVEAIDVLRWQVLGDILKVVSWPLGFLLLASGAGKTFMGTEWLAMATFVIVTHLLMPVMGIAATGASFLVMYIILLWVVWVLAVRRTNFAWTSEVKRHALLIFASGVAIHMLARANELMAAGVGMLLAIAWGVFGLIRLAQTSNLSGPVARLVSATRQALARLGERRE